VDLPSAACEPDHRDWVDRREHRGERETRRGNAVIASRATAILDYLGALAWPIIVAGALVSAFWRPGSKLGNLIGRIGENVAPESQVDTASAQASSVTDEEAEALIDQRAPELVSTVIANLQAEHAVKLEQAQHEAQAVIQRLLRRLAITEIRADFESIYGRIYGSQVAALRTLRAAPNGAARASVEAHLAHVKSNVNLRLVLWLETLRFEEWFGYLQQQGLAEVDTDERYHITTRGACFLAYIEGLGYPLKTF
jgi:hypothetical protein